MSRSTVREALRLLASQNLIVTTRGVAGGSFVVHPSPAQLIETITTGVNLLRTSRQISPQDILEARLFVERPVAALVAERRTEQDLQALRESLFDPRTADFEMMAEIHSTFHETMADACGNPLLTMIAKPFHRIANAREVLLGRFGREFWIQVDSDHRAILAAVAAQLSDEAQAATARHIENLAKAFQTEAARNAVEMAHGQEEPSGDALAISAAGAV